MAAWRNFSLSVEEYFTGEQREEEKYVSTSDEKYCISKLPCNILFIK